MSISPIPELFFYAGYVRSASDFGSLKRVAESSVSTILKGTDSSVSQEQKNSIVSGQIDDNKNSYVYDYRYLPNVPLSKPQESGRTYNESEKIQKRETGKKNFSDYINFVETSDNESSDAPETGKGFYIVLNDQYSMSAKKNPDTPEDLRKERIKNIYTPERKRGNGILVDLIL